MKYLPYATIYLFFCYTAFATSQALAQSPASDLTPPWDSQQATAQAAAQGKFSFIMFYRDDNDLARAMAQAIMSKTAQRSDVIVSTFVRITNPTEAAIVRQFDVAQAPMPLTIVTAPNGAITGTFSEHVSEQQLETTITTPVMSQCLKAIQDGKIVFLCLQTTPKVLVSRGVFEFLVDPQFSGCTQIVPIPVGDPAEAKLIKELELGTQLGDPYIALFAPPGVLVGKFLPACRKTEIVAALHKAAKSCDDPNCKQDHTAKLSTAFDRTSTRYLSVRR